MTTQDNRPRQPHEAELDLRDLLASLWGGKYIIAICAALFVLHGAWSAFNSLPSYQASGVLQLEGKSGSMALPAGMQFGDGYGFGSSASQAEMAILRSRMVMREAVRALDLQVYAEPRHHPWLGVRPERLRLPDPGFAFLRPYAWGNEKIALGTLTLPENLVGNDITLTITGPGRYAITLPDGARAEGEAGRLLTWPEQSLSLLVTELSGPEGREFSIGRMPLEGAVAMAGGGFSVMETPEFSSILTVSYTDRDPKRAEQILDAITEAYVAQNVMRGAAEAQNSLDFIETQLPVALATQVSAQDALNRYRQEQNSVDLDYETQALLQRASAIETELNALVLKEEDLKKRYTVNHPTYQSLLENRAELERQLEQIRQETSGLPETQKDIFNLTRDLEVAQQIYLQLLNRAEELKVIRASTVGSVRIIDTAQFSGVIIADASRKILISLALGLAIGSAIVLVRRFLRRGIRGAEEIEKLGLPVFGTLNYSGDAMNHRKKRGRLPIITLEKPEDLVAEGFRSLRTALHFGMLDAKTNSVLLTSAAPEVGKSFTAINLATMAAQGGQRVCLIDADLRRGYLRRYIGQEKNAAGLAEYLAGAKSLDEVLVPGPVGGLSVITTGRYPPNPSELLMRPAFPALLETLNAQFDLILIDSPPVLAVTDPVVIGRYTGATIMVVRHMETMPSEIEAVRHAFETAGGRVTGAVLNGYRPELGRSASGHYHYNYRYSYKSDRSSEGEG